jgi:hypothetical protein
LLDISVTEFAIAEFEGSELLLKLNLLLFHFKTLLKKLKKGSKSKLISKGWKIELMPIFWDRLWKGIIPDFFSDLLRYFFPQWADSFTPARGSKKRTRKDLSSIKT